MGFQPTNSGHTGFADYSRPVPIRTETTGVGCRYTTVQRVDPNQLHDNDPCRVRDKPAIAVVDTDWPYPLEPIW